MTGYTIPLTLALAGICIAACLGYAVGCFRRPTMQHDTDNRPHGDVPRIVEMHRSWHSMPRVSTTIEYGNRKQRIEA